MPVKNLPLTAQQVGDCLDVCETAASRKVGEAEALITEVILTAGERLTRSGRPDRIKSAILPRLRTLGAIGVNHPGEWEDWIARLMDNGSG